MMTKRHIAIALVLAAGFVSGCRDSGAVPAGSNQAPVILISIDTLRSDRLPAYGYGKIETPKVDAFRADSILYERAYTHCPLTLPAHGSMLTGRLPADHGLRDNVGYHLGQSVPTLATVLKKNGYATGAAISAFVLRKETGIDQGFDFYDDQVRPLGPSQAIGRVQRPGPETITAARDWIEKQSGPFFFFLHLYEPHTPYDAPEPFRSRYDNAYDAEVAYTDQLVGEFLDFLKGRDLYDRALIILTSDHGEALGQHGEDEHGMFLYRETIQIPLIVKLPKAALKAKAISNPAQLVDIFPTVVEQTQSAHDTASLPGSSLLRLDQQPDQARAIYSETYYPRFHFGWSDLHSLVDGEFHLIQAPRPELYRLVEDPGETQNVLTEHRRTYAALRRTIEPLVREAAAPAPVNAEEAAQLAALGYLGSSITTDPGEELPDPKDKILTFQEIRRAFTYFRDKRHADALELINRLLDENPRMLDLWDLKSKALQQLGRLDEALAAGKEGLKLSPNADHLAISVANLALELGRYDDAEKHAQLALRTEPGQGREILARIWMARGDLERAEKEIRTALETKRDRTSALMTLARLEKERNRLDVALGHLDEAMAELSDRRNRHLMNLHFLRGDVLARLGREREAEAEFRKEIDLFPDQTQAYKNLILLLVTEDRIPEATQLIYRLIEASPTPPAYVAVCEVLDVVGDARGVRYWARRGLERFPKDSSLRRFATG
jgi:arylsulfatase A-like enzyme/Flp pilus assembly protein TadD